MKRKKWYYDSFNHSFINFIKREKIIVKSTNLHRQKHLHLQRLGAP